MVETDGEANMADAGTTLDAPPRVRQTEDTFVPRAEDLFNVPIDN